jgi:hypothetical protein
MHMTLERVQLNALKEARHSNLHSQWPERTIM